ncbi:MAG: segregation and condensation protein B [Pseudohongiellaceae bacterium]|jgi:segregation and condensation protein B
MNDVDNKVKMIVEGLLLAAGRPLSLENISQVFSEEERPDKAELEQVMETIALSCGDRGFELKEIASGFRFQVKQELSEWVAKLWEDRPPKYTRALLETLALVAYRQPITRGDIEEIRGVGVSSNIIRTLLDREWIRVVGHRDVPGRPAMFATTKQFLDYFNLKSLQELPPLAEIKDLAETAKEFNLEDVLAESRVLDLPEDATDESSFEISMTDQEKQAEAEAIELSKKPLDEILAAGMPLASDLDIDLEDDEFEDGELEDGEATDESLSSQDLAQDAGMSNDAAAQDTQSKEPGHGLAEDDNTDLDSTLITAETEDESEQESTNKPAPAADE